MLKRAATEHRDISIHAPRAGCDTDFGEDIDNCPKFQSTHPVRGATLLPETVAQLLPISIHAPRAGCDM